MKLKVCLNAGDNTSLDVMIGKNRYTLYTNSTLEPTEIDVPDEALQDGFAHIKIIKEKQCALSVASCLKKFR